MAYHFTSSFVFQVELLSSSDSKTKLSLRLNLRLYCNGGYGISTPCLHLVMDSHRNIKKKKKKKKRMKKDVDDENDERMMMMLMRKDQKLEW